MVSAKKIISGVNSLLGKFWASCLSYTYNRQYRKLYKNSKEESYIPSKKEIRSYQSKWRDLKNMVNPVYYKLFSNCIAPDVNIVPEDVAHNVIEALLNPPIYRGVYEDKNMYDKILCSSFFPCTILHKIDGVFYDDRYKYINISDNLLLDLLSGHSKIIVKETINTSSGLGVHLFEKNKNGEWIESGSNNILNLKNVNQLMGKNFIIQEYAKQSDFMSQFNPTSVNTLRLLVYKSVKTNEVHMLNAIMRIGKNGSFLDNGHQGGATIGINKKGELNKFLTDQYGNKFVKFNGIDFSASSFKIPCWDKIVAFATQIGENVLYHRCLNLDVMIDFNGFPKLIEFNIRSMSIWIYQFNTSPCFGEYTDEIIAYCKEHKKEIKSEYLYL